MLEESQNQIKTLETNTYSMSVSTTPSSWAHPHKYALLFSSRLLMWKKGNMSDPAISSMSSKSMIFNRLDEMAF